ncbi:ribonucleoside diphosphage reductase 1, beta subunit, B2 [Escherichia coli TA206]|nr:ribonucleoside diphosphage reductase 1, beta subunit, B2 [Escherichia coli TA206]
MSVGYFAGCDVSVLSGYMSTTVVGLIRRASVASGVDCRMRRERLIRPTQSDKTRQHHIRHCSSHQKNTTYTAAATIKR